MKYEIEYMDIESELYYDDNRLYKLYTRNCFKCMIALSDVINNIDLS